VLRYFVVLVVSLFVTEPDGVSTRWVVRVVSVDSGLLSAGLASAVALELAAGAAGCTIVVEDEAGASFATVSFCATGSFTMVVELVWAGRSQAASEPSANTVNAVRANFMEIS
jgi:hypothetical protein